MPSLSQIKAGSAFAIVVAVQLFFAGPSRAQEACTGYGGFPAFVLASERSLAPASQPGAAEFLSANDLANAIDLAHLESGLERSGFGTFYGSVLQFRDKVQSFAAHARASGPLITHRLSQTPSFQNELRRMVRLVESLCTTHEMAATSENEESARGQRMGDAFRTIGDRAGSRTNKVEHLSTLLWLFGALAGWIVGLLALARSWDRLYALVNSRKSCAIPGTLRIAGMTAPGNVVILGRRGLRFEFEMAAHALTPESSEVGTSALINIGTHTFPLRLVTYGARTNGFLFFEELAKDTQRALLRQSLTKPRTATDIGALRGAIRALAS